MAKKRPMPSTQDAPPQNDRAEDRHQSTFMIRLPDAYRDCLRQVQDAIEEQHGYRPRLTDLVAKELRDLFVSLGIKPPSRRSED
jgi:hypothetical protein